MKIETEYDIGDKVWITVLERPGKVSSIWITQKGIQYEVRYFEGGKLQEVYFTKDEIQKEKP